MLPLQSPNSINSNELTELSPNKRPSRFQSPQLFNSRPNDSFSATFNYFDCANRRI